MIQSLSDRHQEKRKNADEDEEVSLGDEERDAHYDGREEASKRSHRQVLREDKQLDSSSSEQQADDYNSNRPKRNPYCSRCRNHGKSAQVKGHKRHCEYRDCQCEGCKLVECRQIVSAAQIKRRRYQKQDEECGRRIEISPPVLHREPNNDPATLIAKTLIGSANAKHLQQQTAVHKQLNATAHTHLAAPASSSQSNSVIHHHHHHQQHGQVASHLQTPQTTPSILASSPAVNPQQQQISSAVATNIHGTRISQLNELALGQQHSPQQRADSSAALSTAFNLFRFPGSVLSAAAAASMKSPAVLHQPSPAAIATINQATSSSGSGSSNNNNNNNSCISSSLPSLREQINLVEEIYHAFGPLAIYAWLRSEQFDLQKVRDSIEISHGPYNNLLDLISKYRISASDHHNSKHLDGAQQQHSRIGNHDELPSSAADHHQTSAGCNHSQTYTSPTTTTTTNSHHQCSSSIGCATSNLTPTTSYLSPLYTLGGNFRGPANANGLIGCTSGAFSPADLNRSSLSLANTFSSLPMTTAQSLLWPELKLASSNGSQATVLHSAHHLLPHFMHHHPFMTHHLNNHANDQQQQQRLRQSQQQQASPTGSTLTNSSCSESS